MLYKRVEVLGLSFGCIMTILNMVDGVSNLLAIRKRGKLVLKDFIDLVHVAPSGKKG